MTKPDPIHVEAINLVNMALLTTAYAERSSPAGIDLALRLMQDRTWLRGVSDWNRFALVDFITSMSMKE